MADARFRLRRAMREATLRSGQTWEGGKVRRSASGVVTDAFEAYREAMIAELQEIERQLGRRD